MIRWMTSSPRDVSVRYKYVSIIRHPEYVAAWRVSEFGLKGTARVTTITRWDQFLPLVLKTKDHEYDFCTGFDRATGACRWEKIVYPDRHKTYDRFLDLSKKLFWDALVAQVRPADRQHLPPDYYGM